MRSKVFALLTAAIVLVSGLEAHAAPAGSAAGDDSSKFTVSDKTQIPGATLAPGTYSIQLVDHLSDRIVIRVDNPSTNVHAVFLGLQNPALHKPSSAGAINWSSGAEGNNAIRGFAFPGGTVVEFVYPKGEAVALAKANATTVPAIDPESEGRVAAPSLSKDDMKMVTLWMLSPTEVGPGETGPGIKAARFQPGPKVHPHVVMASLPHTAGVMPLVWLAGVFAFGFAALLGVRRRILAVNR